MSDCDRCDGDGTIHAKVGDLLCPNCHDDVCQWCNSRFEDGEPLGDSGLSVCRPCIRDMARYKEDAAYAFYLAHELDSHVDELSDLQATLSEYIQAAFAEYDLEVNNGDWINREPEGYDAE